jgi:uncharacterized membrane protein
MSVPPPLARPVPLNRRQRWALAIILLAAAFLRVVDLDHPPFWEDEIVTVQNLFADPWLPLGETRVDHARLMAQQRVSGWDEYLENVFRHEDSPPLYFEAIRVWSMAAGISETRLRLFSVLLGFLAVVIFVGLARRLLPPWPALAATLLMAAHPFVVEYSREARTYALVLLLAVTALRLLWVIGEGSGKWWHRVLFVAVNAALLYAHYQTLFFIAAEAAALLVVWRRWSGLLWVGAAGVLFLPGAATLIRKLTQFQTGQREIWVQAAGAPWTVLGWLSTAATLPKKYLAGNLVLAKDSWLLAPLAILALLVAVRLAAGARAHWRRDSRSAGALLLLLAVPITAVFLADLVLKMNTIQAPRYLIFLMPVVLLLGVMPLGTPCARRLDSVLAVLLAVSLGAGFAWYFSHGKHGIEWRDRVAELQARTTPDDLVVVDYKRDALLVAWYLQAPRRIFLGLPDAELVRVIDGNPGRRLVYLPRNETYLPDDPAAFPLTRLSPLVREGRLVPESWIVDPRRYRPVLYYRIAGRAHP